MRVTLTPPVSSNPKKPSLSRVKEDCTKRNCKNAGQTSLYPASSSKRRKVRDIASAEGNEGEMITFDDIDLTINTTDNELYVL